MKKALLVRATSGILGVLLQMQGWGAPILLKSGPIDPSDANVMSSRAPLKALAQQSAKGGARVYIVQKDGLVDAAWRTALAEAGAKILRYLPENAYLVRATAEAAAKIEQGVPHTYLGEYRPEHRIDASIQKSATPTSDWPRVFEVRFFDATDREAAAAAIDALDGCRVMCGNDKALRAELTQGGVETVSALTTVEWVEPYRVCRLQNDIAVSRSRMDVTAVWPGGETGLGLTGAGQVVAVADSGLDTGNLDTLHEDIRGQVSRVYARGRSDDWDWSDKLYVDYIDQDGAEQKGWRGGHGTHVTGSVLGNGAMSNGKIKGAAYEARLIFQSLMNPEGSLMLPADLNELFRQAYEDEEDKPGARIHSNSWGSEGHGEYVGRSQDVDEFTFEHPDLLVVLSAGNHGVDADGDGVVDLHSLNNVCSAKNCLTVGASDNQRSADEGAQQGMASFSSRGPCADGRIKPDVVAPGTSILSTKVVDSPDDDKDSGVYDKYYRYMSGTSMSTPLTSGAAALVRQWLVRDVGIVNPDGATVKALLMAGAKSLCPGRSGTGEKQEIPKTCPNNVEGWGQVNLGQTVVNAGGIVVKDAQVVRSDEVQSFTVNVPEDGTLSVVMAYADAPGATSASKALVNDLDLLVNGPDGKTYHPNSGSSPDRVNNVEGVRLDAAKAGDYVITVRAYNIATPMSTSLTGGKSNAVRYSLAVLGARMADDRPPPGGDRPDLRPSRWVADKPAQVWTAPIELLTEEWDVTQPYAFTGKTVFSTNDEVYVNWAAKNFSGTVAVEESFHSELLIDGQRSCRWACDAGLRPGSWARIVNKSIGKLSAGMHTVKLVVDCDNVVDRLYPDWNTYEMKITVTDGSAQTSFAIDGGTLVKYTGAGGDVTIPEDVTSIGEGAFENCAALTSVTIPPGVTNIGRSAFCCCTGLKEVEIPSAVTSIGYDAFRGAGLTKVTVPSGVTSIDDYAFAWCDGLTEIAVEDGNAAYRSKDGVLYDKTGTVLIQCPAGRSGAFSIPSGVTRVRYRAFVGCRKLTSLDIPPTVMEVGVSAFESCAGLTAMEFPSSMTVLANTIFWNCSALESVTIPPTVTRIGTDAFHSCDRLTTVYVAAGDVRRVASLYAFPDSVKFVELVVAPTAPTGVVATDGADAEKVCVSWTEVEGAASYRVYRSEAPSRPVEPSWTVATSPYSDATAMPGVEYRYWVEAVNSAGSAVSQPDSGYRAVSLSLGGRADSFPASGGSGSVAVSANASWTATADAGWITLGSTGGGTLAYEVSASRTTMPRTGTITVAAGEGTAHPASPATVSVTQEGAREFVLADGVLIEYNGTGGDVTVPDGVTSIGEGAFQSCELSTVVVPPGVTSIGANAFACCRRLTAVTIPSGVKSVGDRAFDGCTSLATIRVSGSGGMGDIRRLLSESGLDADGVTFVRCEVEQQTSVSDVGWHEVSFSVLPEGGLPEAVFAPVADKIGYVTFGSQNWNPLTGGTLTALEIGKGYWLQTTADTVAWTVTGQPNPDVEIALKPGWSLIGYPLLEEGEIETVLATALATGNIRYIYSGSRVYPGTLTTMAPGKGYWVYAEAAATVRFDAK